MRQELLNSFGDLFLVVEFDSQNNWIYNNWRGLLSTDSVRQGCLQVLNLLEQTHCPYILNDNREVLGSWEQANEWIEHYWIPQAAAAGLRYHAHVVAPGVFGQAAAEDMHLRVGNHFQMHLFEDAADARRWLRAVQQANSPSIPG